MRADRLSLGELDALVVTNLVNVRYLTGYTGSNGVAVVGGDGRRLFFTDFRYMTQAGSEVSGFEVVRGERDLLGDVAAAVSGRVGFEDGSLSVRRLARLRELAGGGPRSGRAAAPARGRGPGRGRAGGGGGGRPAGWGAGA